MTRKKFIKMLMGAGMQRNDAADCAQLAQEAGRAYFPVLGDLLNYHLQHFKRPAIGIMWLRIRGTIIHGANTPAWYFFRSIDEWDKVPVCHELQRALGVRGCAFEPTIRQDAEGNMRITEVSLVRKAGGGNE